MKKLLVGVAAAALVSTAASATVTGDAASGWYVGKGDVQSAYGWNNAILQENWNAGEISFYFDSSSTFDVSCEWDTVNKKQTIHHLVESSISRGLNANLISEGKLRNQITGFFVSAAGAGDAGDVPAVGDSCGDYDDVGGNANDGIITSVVMTGSGGGGLYVSWEGNDVLLQAAL